MSKQHLADMLKSMTTGDMDAAKAHFSLYSTEKSQEILARSEQTEEVEATEEEPTATPEDETKPEDNKE